MDNNLLKRNISRIDAMSWWYSLTDENKQSHSNTNYGGRLWYNLTGREIEAMHKGYKNETN